MFNENGLQQLNETGWRNEGDDLDQKALVAKRDAQAKRKQIPPFVQKLSRQACCVPKLKQSLSVLMHVQLSRRIPEYGIDQMVG